MDIVVFGATGFVGRLVARYLAEHAPAGVTIGLAGRSPEKLQRTAADLGVDWPLVVADTSDEASLAAMRSGARVVATTVGPYWPAGLKLVDACIATGTHYLYLTGEILFVHQSISRHDRAGASGARIVHSCGFDSIPSDLGVLMLHEAGGEMSDTMLVVKALRGGFSGDTLASLKGQIDEVRRDSAARKTMLDPNALLAHRPATAPARRRADARQVRFIAPARLIDARPAVVGERGRGTGKAIVQAGRRGGRGDVDNCAVAFGRTCAAQPVARERGRR